MLKFIIDILNVLYKSLSFCEELLELKKQVRLDDDLELTDIKIFPINKFRKIKEEPHVIFNISML